MACVSTAENIPTFPQPSLYYWNSRCVLEVAKNQGHFKLKVMIHVNLHETISKRFVKWHQNYMIALIKQIFYFWDRFLINPQTMNCFPHLFIQKPKHWFSSCCSYLALHFIQLSLGLSEVKIKLAWICSELFLLSLLITVIFSFRKSLHHVVLKPCRIQYCAFVILSTFKS